MLNPSCWWGIAQLDRPKTPHSIQTPSTTVISRVVCAISLVVTPAPLTALGRGGGRRLLRGRPLGAADARLGPRHVRIRPDGACATVGVLGVVVAVHGRDAIRPRRAHCKWRVSTTLHFHVAGAPIARSVTQITPFTLILLQEPKRSDQMESVALIWELGHVEKGPDVFAEPPHYKQRGSAKVSGAPVSRD